MVVLWIVAIFFSSAQPLLLESAERPISIHTIEWTDNEWLIGGDTIIKSGDRLYINPLLVEFSGDTLTDISSSLNIGEKVIDKIVWNGQYVLLAYSFQEYGGVLQYKNNIFSHISLPGQPSLRATTMDWNGEYWLIGSNFLGYGYLIQYNGTTVKDVELNISAVRSLVWMGNFWFISTTTPHWEDHMVLYNGNTVEEVQSPEGLGSITESAWNGEYALLISENSLVRFDNEHFEEIGYTRSAYELQWNGEYWLIGGTQGTLTMYNGVLLTDITEKAGFTGNISALGWNGEYWLIGDTAGNIKIYDGITFTDLTPQLEDSILISGIKSSTEISESSGFQSDNMTIYMVFAGVIIVLFMGRYVILNIKRKKEEK